MANILAISYYKPDTGYLIDVLDILAKKGHSISFIITSSGELSQQAEELVKQKNYQLITIPKVNFSTSRNPFYRYKQDKVSLKAAADRLLSQHNFQLVFTSTDLYNGVLFEACNQKGIPTVYIQWTETHSLKTHQAWWSEEERFYNKKNPTLYTLKRKILRPLERLAGYKKIWPFNYKVDHLFLQGEFYKQMALEGGVNESIIEVTGNPQCDEINASYTEITPAVINTVRDKLGASDNQKILLHTREHYARIKHLAEKDIITSQKKIYEAMKEACPDGKWVIKMHPKENEVELKQVREICPDAIIIKNELKTGDLIAGCDILIGTTSSTLVWGMGINKPTISAYFWETAPDFNLRRHWFGVEKADTYNQLVNSIVLNLTDETHKKVWEEKRQNCIGNFVKLGGNCTNNIAERLTEIINKKES